MHNWVEGRGGLEKTFTLKPTELTEASREKNGDLCSRKEAGTLYII